MLIPDAVHLPLQGTIELEATNRISIRKDKHERRGDAREATVPELRKALAERSMRVMDVFRCVQTLGALKKVLLLLTQLVTRLHGRAFDRNGDGRVEKSEFRAALPLLGFSVSSTAGALSTFAHAQVPRGPPSRDLAVEVLLLSATLRLAKA